ncbi:MAG: hypothetical protein K2X97_01805 [Mycobacteriaceae bacterium]|nr:hypothetical protein [Mycobacteriaceae bacterium]
MSDVLKAERETYQRELPNLLDREGQFVLVKGDEVVGVWATRSSALSEGYMRFGSSGFMVRQISATQPVIIMRPTVVSSCPSCTAM